MAIIRAFLVLLTLAEVTLALRPVPTQNISSPLTRKSFPPGFLFGASGSAYQFEGAASEDGRRPSMWDTYSKDHPERILDHTTGDVAIDFYHRYKEDIELMKYEGMDAFRFSISWSRVLPYGKLSKGINQHGITFYKNLIDEIIAKGIVPMVTIFHWDVPQALEDEYQGFLSPHIVDDFRDFADLCFREFGEKVKLFATINEPWTFSSKGYDSGDFAPGRCSPFMNPTAGCLGGDSATEPYIVGHHIILAHAAAAKVYREKYQATQKGKVGIVLVSHWFEPYSSTPEDKKAAQQAIDFMFGWTLHPLTYGDYPKSMRTLVGDRLPKFTSDQSEMAKGSLDFLGLNYYTARYAKYISSPNKVNISYTYDSLANLTSEKNGKLIGAATGSTEFFVVPSGLQKLLLYTKNNYKNPIIYITECGMSSLGVTSIVKEGVNDTERVDFYNSHILAVKHAIGLGAKVEGFFAWSFFDNYEWSSGFTSRFGLNFIDYENGLKRFPKKSALWMKKFLQQDI
ncbi:unnamed protein product [Cuscuta epithymum]|uniref:Beta-glucosidase n=1 Tax=Cuscuta epithymum TaxID=186058 RepID=A0AAV0GIN7_9ASTE|nr:unnamed protein product [Cuscuta epithymum]